jgi:hypothetical protein
MELNEKDVLSLKEDLYGEKFKCKNCVDYEDAHCSQKGIAVDPDETGCVLFINIK